MPGKSQRILIVDDDQDILANLADILNDVGYETDTAGSAELAIRKIDKVCVNRCRYDLCLLDFKMPGMDGVELFQQIQQQQPDVRALVITAYAGDDDVRRAEEAGALQVLRKPVDVPHLLSLIDQAMA